MRRQEQRFGELIAKSGLKREHRVAAVLEHVFGDNGAVVVHVLNGPDTRQAVEVDHERRVSGVHDLVLWRQALVDEPQEVVLGHRVQVQGRLVQEQDHVSVLQLLDLREIDEEAEEPDEPL